MYRNLYVHESIRHSYYSIYEFILNLGVLVESKLHNKSFSHKLMSCHVLCMHIIVTILECYKADAVAINISYILSKPRLCFDVTCIDTEILTKYQHIRHAILMLFQEAGRN